MTGNTTNQNDPAGVSRWLVYAKLALGPFLAAVAYAALGHFTIADSAAPPLTDEARAVAAVLLWMGAWWLSEAIPLPATALLPLIALPLTGAVSLADASSPYASRIIFLFMGGFMLALSMQKWNLHKRIALVALTLVGSSSARMIGGFMLTAAVLSMWVSNTATTVMMLPIAASVVTLVDERTGSRQKHFATALMLGIAYSASIGGLATPIGSPPNAILIGFLSDNFGVEISFTTWMMVGLPLAAVFVPIVWILLTRILHKPEVPTIPGGREFIRESLHSLGPLSKGELVVMLVFFTTVTAWLSRGFIAEMDNPLGTFVASNIDDATIAIASAVALFVIPINAKRDSFALDWETTKELPWGVLLLFGGGLSLAGAVKSSGLDAFIGSAVSALEGTPTPLIVLASTAIVVFLTEMTSNTATATIFVSILTGVAIALGVDPLILIVPATLAASCAFMMPVATPPNAIVYGSGRVTMSQMARAGVLLNILSIILTVLATYSIATWVLGIDHTAVPDWAQTGGDSP